jgi:hypothetical protein
MVGGTLAASGHGELREAERAAGSGTGTSRLLSRSGKPLVKGTLPAAGTKRTLRFAVPATIPSD